MTNFIVSGCPRSGTSLTMRILFNSGMEIAKDEQRKADEDNPHGYFEIQSIINKLEENPEIIFDFNNKILKVTHFGIQFLPKGDYKIIYIERNIEEILDSMEKMMGEKDSNRDETKKLFLHYNEKVKKMMQEREDIKFIIINFKDLITNPAPEIDKIIEFYVINPTKKENMMKAVDPSLYRNKRT